MALPPYHKSIFWQEFKNDTPTFRLTPVDKPDMSPYLIHMTGKAAIASILKGEGRPAADRKAGEGFLKSSVPEYAKEASKATGSGFDAPVVCFTESPTFAIDYFRYRSFKRWKADLLFGIGFHKERMVDRGIRPVLYMDSALTKLVVSIHHSLHKRGSKAVSDPEVKKKLVQVVDSLYPLIFPLLEALDDQGFMWEREWRCPDPKGFVFSHTDIALICCPDTEEPVIRNILGTVQNQVKFIRTWEEYDEVTDYLQRQQAVWNSRRKSEKTKATLKQKLKELEEQIRARKAAANQLGSYTEAINRLAKEAALAEERRQQLLSEVEAFEEEMKQLEEEQSGQPKTSTAPAATKKTRQSDS